MIRFAKDDIPENEIQEEFLCAASGPGGQHVNRTATAVRLIFHAETSTLLSEGAKLRLYHLAGSRAADGTVSILVKDSRSLAMNRDIARERLAELIAKALAEPRKRKKTKPSKASKERRMKAKSVRSKIKSERSSRNFD